jgi:multisubunit Na+/H+ antiporter MnhC subunit
MTDYLPIIALYGIGVYCILTRRNAIKVVIGLNLLEAATVMSIVLVGRVPGGEAPIVTHGRPPILVDPLPQAMALTAIVIGAATTAVILSLVIKTYHSCGTLDLQEALTQARQEEAQAEEDQGEEPQGKEGWQ